MQAKQSKTKHTTATASSPYAWVAPALLFLLAAIMFNAFRNVNPAPPPTPSYETQNSERTIVLDPSLKVTPSLAAWAAGASGKVRLLKDIDAHFRELVGSNGKNENGFKAEPVNRKILHGEMNAVFFFPFWPCEGGCKTHGTRRIVSWSGQKCPLPIPPL